MKKKSFEKKLTLSKSTVVNLNNLEMKQVKGGYATACCGTDPDCTYGCIGGPESVKFTNCVTQCCTVIECTVDWGC
jgi:natural product precursor